LAYLALDRLDGALGSEDPLIPRRLADQQPAVLGQTDKRRQDRITVLVRADVRLAVAQDRHFTIGRAQIDPDDAVHRLSPLSPLAMTSERRAPARSEKRGHARGSRAVLPQ